MNSSLTPCTSVGGCSALCIRLSTNCSSNPSWPSSGAVPAPPRIISKALARFLYAAETSRGRGSECAFCGCREPLVSTRSRVPKKVDKSGRRRGCSFCSAGTLCSTATISWRSVHCMDNTLTVVTGHPGCIDSSNSSSAWPLHVRIWTCRSIDRCRSLQAPP